jgi:hypothetical protein
MNRNPGFDTIFAAAVLRFPRVARYYIQSATAQPPQSLKPNLNPARHRRRSHTAPVSLSAERRESNCSRSTANPVVQCLPLPACGLEFLPASASLPEKRMTPRIALIIRSHREGVARLPRALRQAGLHLTLFARPGSFAAATLHRDAFHNSSPPRHKLLRLSAVLIFLRRLERSRALRAIPGDEDALVYLARVRHLIRRFGLRPLFARATIAIEGGLPAGAPARVLLSRTAVASIADKCGIVTPPWAACSDHAGIVALCRNRGFPLIVKRDDTSAGMGVRTCRNTEQLADAVASAGPDGIVQAFVRGKTAMQAAVALDGKLLGSFGWIKEQCFPEPFGPSAIVARIDDASMKRAAAAFVEATGFNGFLSLDFILSDEGPSLIEINPRPTPVCHLGGLAEAFASALGAPGPTPVGAVPLRLAVFPQELRRNPGSADDGDLVHDLPVDDPPLLRALCDAFLDGRVPVVKRCL